MSDKTRTCGYCHGAGTVLCSNCGGDGYVTLPNGIKQVCQKYEPCGVCNGWGEVPA